MRTTGDAMGKTSNLYSSNHEFAVVQTQTSLSSMKIGTERVW